MSATCLRRLVRDLFDSDWIFKRRNSPELSSASLIGAYRASLGVLQVKLAALMSGIGHSTDSRILRPVQTDS